jgi:asparagine synthetase A
MQKIVAWRRRVEVQSQWQDEVGIVRKMKILRQDADDRVDLVFSVIVESTAAGSL